LLNRERDSERGGAPLKFCPLPLPREAYAKGPGGRHVVIAMAGPRP
jgi:hypothetical protein